MDHASTNSDQRAANSLQLAACCKFLVYKTNPTTNPQNYLQTLCNYLAVQNQQVIITTAHLLTCYFLRRPVLTSSPESKPIPKESKFQLRQQSN
jgi:hypothetical protein